VTPAFFKAMTEKKNYQLTFAAIETQFGAELA